MMKIAWSFPTSMKLLKHPGSGISASVCFMDTWGYRLNVVRLWWQIITNCYLFIEIGGNLYSKRN